MYEFLLIIHVIICAMLIGLVLLQHGKGAQAGAAFGSGASQTVFGSQGSGGFLSQATAVLATLFFLMNLVLAYLINKGAHTNQPAKAPVEQTMPKEEKSQPAEQNSDVPVVND
jgi:preprotein translocase subunit SecG